jgi:hypothetical protein
MKEHLGTGSRNKYRQQIILHGKQLKVKYSTEKYLSAAKEEFSPAFPASQ